MSRPLELTTPSNVVALAGYGWSAALGLSLISGLNHSPTYTDFWRELGFYGWSITLSVCGLFALFCIKLARRRGWLELAMRGEFWCALGLAFAFALWGLALLISSIHALDHGVLFAIRLNLTAKILVGACIYGGVGRAWQIRHERRAWMRSKADPHPADPPPLAAPEN